MATNSSSSLRKQPIPFGKYLLLDRINIGGMAEVWRGKTFGAGGFERLVAIKRILPNIAEDEEFITMFIDEAKITVQLTHANIAQIYELGHIQTSYFIAMEYIPGKDMRAIFDRCRKKGEPAPVPLTCYVMSKVCEGLDYAHRKKDGMGRDMNIVHRDVSPQNVLISYEGEIKLIDFGIAKAAGKATKTQAGILKGKFGYMSPEQIRGLPLDRRSDIFAAGVCLYEMLTGERLFVGDSDFSVLEKVRKADVLPPSTYNRKVPAELEKIVMKALAKDVEDRYQYANELADDLQRFLITSDSIFSRKDLLSYMKSTFAEEVEREKQRLQEYAEIHAPDGMQLNAEMPFVAPAVAPAPAPVEPATGLATAADVSTVTPQVALPQTNTTTPALPPTTPAKSPGPSLSNLPKLTPVSPLLTSPAENTDKQQTQLVNPNQFWGDGADTGPQPAPPAMAAEAPGPTGPTAVMRPSSPQLPSLPLASPPLGAAAQGLVLSSPTVPATTDPRDRAAAAPATWQAHTNPQEQVTDGATPTVGRSLRGRGGSNKRLRLMAAAGGIAGLLSLLLVVVLLVTGRSATGWLWINVPAEARGKVRVNVGGEDIREPDGRPVREWPVLRQVRAGPVPVMVVGDGFEEYLKVIDVKEGQEVTKVEVGLKRTARVGTLTVTPVPPGAEVSIDGTAAKAEGVVGPFRGEVTADEEHLVEVRAAGHRPLRQRVRLKEGEAQVLEAKLEPHEYRVAVASEPSGATIFVNGKPVSQAPSEIRVSYGTTELLLKKRCYELGSAPLSLPAQPEGPISVSVPLRRQQGCR